MWSMSGSIKTIKSACEHRKVTFKVLTFEKPIENRAIAVLQCVYTYKREVCRRENLLSFVSNMDCGQQVYSFGQTGMNGGEMLCNVQ